MLTVLVLACRSHSGSWNELAHAAAKACPPARRTAARACTKGIKGHLKVLMSICPCLKMIAKQTCKIAVMVSAAIKGTSTRKHIAPSP